MNSNLQTHLREHALKSFVINLVINGLLTWLLLRGKPAFDAWGEHGYGVDMLLTGFFLSALITVFIIKLNRAQIANGKHEALAQSELGTIARLAPRNDWLSSLVFGVAGTLFALTTVGVMELLPLPPFEALGYAVFKGVWSGVLAALLVPSAIRIGLRAAI